MTFSFNGGPGSSSVWLHLGILGPQRVATDEMGNAPPPPYALVDNEHTLLTDSDLVFIDPIGTGHSRMAEGEKTAEFHDYQRDLDSVGDFIRLWLTRHGRWDSPKYLIGELRHDRAAGLSLHLQEKHDIFLNGLMLVSLAIDLQTLSFDHGNELPYALFLPTYAAAAWYHQALMPELQKRPLRDVVAQAEALRARRLRGARCCRGSRLDAATREHVADQVARYSGLTTEYVLRSDLRLGEFRYFRELLRHRGQTVGRLDTRFLGIDRDDAGESRGGRRDEQPRRGLRELHQPAAQGDARLRERRALRGARADLGQVDLEGLREQVRQRRRACAARCTTTPTCASMSPAATTTWPRARPATTRSTTSACATRSGKRSRSATSRPGT